MNISLLWLGIFINNIAECFIPTTLKTNRFMLSVRKEETVPFDSPNNLCLKSATIRGSPSRRDTVGCQPRSSLAFEMSGFLLCGSSSVLGLYSIFAFGSIEKQDKQDVNILSTTITLSPLSINLSTKWLPTKPAPPVTTILFLFPRTPPGTRVITPVFVVGSSRRIRRVGREDNDDNDDDDNDDLGECVVGYGLVRGKV
ncbi:hypothetical protein Lal_00022567 [Lupinus albus]|nr:hypothetical protein Lal_00022567 [Lupinus albus]